MSGYTSDYSVRDLLEAVAMIATTANPDQPGQCTQRAFDVARAGAGHPNCPTARQVCVRLNAGRKTSQRTWREWLDVALNETSAFRARSAAKRGTPKRSPEQIRQATAFALRLARHEGDHHLTQAAYRAWREERVSQLDEHLRYVIPTDSQVYRAYGRSWAESVFSIEELDAENHFDGDGAERA